jgi:hypothetical protein
MGKGGGLPGLFASRRMRALITVPAGDRDGEHAVAAAHLDCVADLRVDPEPVQDQRPIE